MLLRAQEELDLDLENSYLVGDALSDLQAAQAVGAHGILVLTGRGPDQFEMMMEIQSNQYLVVDDISSAVDLILATENKDT